MTRERWLLAAIITAGAVVRLALFTGLAVGDDTFYHAQAVGHALGGTWPPEPYHWHTRIAITLPTAALIRLIGLQPLTFVALPLAASVAGIYVTFRIAREFVSGRAALLAAAFYACYPLEIIYATHLFPDVPVGLLESLSLWFWIRGLRHDRWTDFGVAGFCFGVGYLFRETIIMAGPAYLCLWLLFGRWRRSAVLSAVLVAVTIIAAETALYWITTGDPQYRLAAIASQQEKPANIELVSRGISGGGYWTDPLLMLITNQEFGAFQLALVAALLPVWRRHPQMRPLAMWWIAVFVWTFYGPTTPTSFVTLQRDPRYAAAITIPSVIIVAGIVASLPKRWSVASATVLAATGVFSAALDQGTTLIEPHRAFGRSTFAADSTMEPVEYYGAKWHLGLAQPVPFKCAADLGREALVSLFEFLPNTECVPAAQRRYIVFNENRRPDLPGRLTESRWTEVAVFSTPASAGRRLVAAILAPLPGQQERSERIRSIPVLRVFERPR